MQEEGSLAEVSATRSTRDHLVRSRKNRVWSLQPPVSAKSTSKAAGKPAFSLSVICGVGVVFRLAVRNATGRSGRRVPRRVALRLLGKHVFLPADPQPVHHLDRFADGPRWQSVTPFHNRIRRTILCPLAGLSRSVARKRSRSVPQGCGFSACAERKSSCTLRSSGASWPTFWCES